MHVLLFLNGAVCPAGHNARREVEKLLKEYADRAAEVASLAAEVLAHRKLLELTSLEGPLNMLSDPPMKLNTTTERGIPSQVSSWSVLACNVLECMNDHRQCKELLCIFDTLPFMTF